MYSLPGQEDPPDDAEDEDVVEEVVDNERVCPAQSHLSQCTCNLELELSGRGKIMSNIYVCTFLLSIRKKLST